jgi:hypothetical protein
MLVVLLSMLLPLIAVIATAAAFWKLAARILRYGGVTWPLAFPAWRSGWPGALTLSALAHVLFVLVFVALLLSLLHFTGGLRGTLS